jgi:hypothetical protein
MTTDTTLAELLERLREAAEKATPGPWETGKMLRELVLFNPEEGRRIVAECQSKRSHNDAAYIALTNPANVLALCDALERAQGERDHWRAKEDICAQHLQGALHRETELAEELSDAAKLIDDLISAWYGPMPFAWPEMLPEAMVERVTEFQKANSPDRMRWQEEEQEDDD